MIQLKFYISSLMAMNFQRMCNEHLFWCFFFWGKTFDNVFCSLSLSPLMKDGKGWGAGIPARYEKWEGAKHFISHGVDIFVYSIKNFMSCVIIVIYIISFLEPPWQHMKKKNFIIPELLVKEMAWHW